MDTKSKILVAVLVLVILVSIYLTYQRTFIDKDFVITTEESGEE